MVLSECLSDLSEERKAKLTQGALRREARMIVSMIGLYCQHEHGSAQNHLCEGCLELAKYAVKRLSCCPFGEEKPVCAKCKVHCYKPQFRQEIAKVMRFSGPRIITKHPILSLEHLWKSLTVTPPEKPRAKKCSKPIDVSNAENNEASSKH